MHHDYGKLCFDDKHSGAHVQVVGGNVGRRVNPIEDFNHAVLVTDRCLGIGKWNGYVFILIPLILPLEIKKK